MRNSNFLDNTGLSCIALAVIDRSGIVDISRSKFERNTHDLTSGSALCLSAVSTTELSVNYCTFDANNGKVSRIEKETRDKRQDQMRTRK